jgi:PelA/Pel-15E family pectate lyase
VRRIQKIIAGFIALLAAQCVIAQTAITVAQDGSGNFKTIQEAINSLPDAATAQRIILIKKGVYKEKVYIEKNFITLKGENPENTIINISQAREEWRCDNKDDYGCAAINLKGNDITLEELSFINSYGKDVSAPKDIICKNEADNTKTIRPDGHQMALRSFKTTRLIVKHCIFRAYGGDTVSPWNTNEGMFYFKDCVMEGGVDFYCPRGWSLAENCSFICHNNNAAIWHDGSNFKTSKTVLLNCTFTGDDGYKLGRFHKDAQFYLLNCTFSKNMADADIYLVPSKDPKDTLKWGKRVYYYNCKREGAKDYAWYKNNLPADFGINEFNEPWVYDYKWNPLEVVVTTSKVIKKRNLVDEQGQPVSAKDITDPDVADMMLLYQRKNGGWPKHFQGNRNVDYKRVLNDTELKELQSGYEEGIDATIDNQATTREIKYLVTAYKNLKNEKYLIAATHGIEYLLKAQYDNGGWPQYYPDFSSYRSQITYNDNAMINVLMVLQDVAQGKNNFDVIDKGYISKCNAAIQKGVDCILKTQYKQKGKLTAWCAQYNAKTLVPEMARKFELASLSGAESVGIVRFLMSQPNPSKEIIAAVNAAVEWFEKVKISGYNFVEVKAPNEASGKDRVLVKDEHNTMWARFYDLETNEPFFTGRDSKPKKTIAEVENERRIGYSWYGVWPQKLIEKEYPEWMAKWGVKGIGN